MTHPPLVLVLGGARSGKSRFALQRGSELPGPHCFLATAEARDAEMAERIAHHRLARNPMWETIEEPLRVAERLRAVRAGVVVVDCLTLWLANAMEADLDIGRAVAELLEALLGRMAAVVAVSNEVGLGVVPASPLGRRFRDEAGSMNQRIAAAADEVYFLVAGQVLRLR